MDHIHDYTDLDYFPHLADLRSGPRLCWSLDSGFQTLFQDLDQVQVVNPPTLEQ